jgi:hypothetical protein
MFFLTAKLDIKSVICNSTGCFLPLSQIIDKNLTYANTHNEYADTHTKVTHPYTEEDGKTDAEADVPDTFVDEGTVAR